MKEFYYNSLDEYLAKADQYDNPKQVKLFEIGKSESSFTVKFMAVTYLWSAMIGWQAVVSKKYLKELMEKMKSHGHSQGIVLEVGKLR